MEEENPDVPELDLDALTGTDTDPDDELITPDSSMTMPTAEAVERNKNYDRKSGEGSDPPAEDFEAAMALLGFKVNSS